MTTTQHDILSLVADHTEHVNNDSSQPFSRYWCPQDKFQWCKSLEKQLFVYGGGFVSSLRAMERKGWIQNITRVHRYGYAITEDGRVALEQHREQSGFYLP